MRKVSDFLARAGVSSTPETLVALTGKPQNSNRPDDNGKSTFANIGERIGGDNEALRHLLIDTGLQFGALDELKETFGKLVDPLHKLLGTLEWFVIHHTNCGMELFADEVIADLLDDDLGTASFDGKTWSNPHHEGGHAAGHFIKWHTIKNQESSVVQDVRRIREHPLVPANVPVYGYVYDVRTGRLNEVKAATEAGKAKAA